MEPPVKTPLGARRPVTRRAALGLGGTGLVAASLAGCGLFSTDPAGQDDGGADTTGADQPKEAPTLTEQVDAGELPPLEERLPATPMVLEPAEPGRYGGDLRRLMIAGQIGDLFNTTIGYENLVRWRPGIETDLTPDNVIPNVAENVEIGADGAEYTFTLRQGMKWSDGEPFTADDIVFWFEDVASNTELTPVFIDWLNTGGDEPLVVEKVDDYTVVFRFSAPNGLFLVNLATQRGTGLTNKPAHYLRQFHADYADDIDQQVEDAQLDDWIALFQSKANLTENPELPVLNAWVLTSAVGEGTQSPVAERNPYYWKTDADARQLPYIDRVRFDVIEAGPSATEPALLKVTSGEIDLDERFVNQLRNKPVLAQSREQGGYDFFDTIPQQMNQMIVMVNLTHKDQVLREIFTNKDFRIGLSHAVNRQEIIDTVFQRQGEPWQAAPRPESPFYNEELAKQYTEYDVDLANEHLDRVLPDTNDDGIRLRPDGDRLSFQIEVNTGHPDLIDALEVMRGHWREVGVDFSVRSEDQSLFFERMEANDHDAAVWIGGGGLGPTMDPFYYMPYNFNTRYAMPWSFWYFNPDDERAEEPPPETREQVELYREMQRTPDQAEQETLMKQILEIAVDQFYCMGTAIREREYGVVHNRLHNVPGLSVTGWLHANLMPTNPQQYFVAEG